MSKADEMFEELKVFKVGDKVKYKDFENITIYKIDETYFYLKDKYNNIRLIPKTIMKNVCVKEVR